MIITSCYGKERKFETMKEAIDFYMTCVKASEGSEQSRYTRILIQLLEGNTYASDEL